jgi:hypothetical protein
LVFKHKNTSENDNIMSPKHEITSIDTRQTRKRIFKQYTLKCEVYSRKETKASKNITIRMATKTVKPANVNTHN